MHSLFEEQVRSEQETVQYHLMYGTDSFPESLTFFPKPAEFIAGPEEYLGKIRKAKEAVRIPVIASLNGVCDRRLGGLRQKDPAGRRGCA